MPPHNKFHGASPSKDSKEVMPHLRHSNYDCDCDSRSSALDDAMSSMGTRYVGGAGGFCWGPIHEPLRSMGGGAFRA